MTAAEEKVARMTAAKTHEAMEAAAMRPMAVMMILTMAVTP
jgi:hypothetical protein